MKGDGASPTALPGWGTALPKPPKGGAWFLGIAAIVAIALASLIHPLLGVAGALIVAGAVVYGLWGIGRAFLRSVGARPLRSGEAPRLENIVAGLAADIRIAPPPVWLIGGEPNALVVWVGGPQLVIARSLVKNFTRTELEAVVARLLVAIVTGDAKSSTYATFFGGDSLDRRALDVRAAALTRYPPALASALRKLSARNGRYRRLWLVAQREDVEARAAALLDL